MLQPKLRKINGINEKCYSYRMEVEISLQKNICYAKTRIQMSKTNQKQ